VTQSGTKETWLGINETQSIAGVVQIENLLSQWRSQVPKRHFRFHGVVLSPTHSWLNQDQKSVTSVLQKLFEKKFSWTATINH
jgi:repressor of nif and glnA expression